MSVLAKGMIFAILVALVLSSFPTVNVLAIDNTKALETKWSQLVSNYNRQSINHTSVHNWVDHWLLANKKITTSEKEKVMKHLSACNSAFASAASLVVKHAGFDAKGKVIERSLAQKSIKDLAYYLGLHARSVKNLNQHVNK